MILGFSLQLHVHDLHESKQSGLAGDVLAVKRQNNPFPPTLTRSPCDWSNSEASKDAASRKQHLERAALLFGAD